MSKPIYLDYQATTPVDPAVLDAMLPYFSEKYGNPHSREHSFGWEAESAVDLAREQLADSIGANSKEIIFTSGATESNNMVIKGLSAFYRGKKQHIVTVATEHKCILESCKTLERDGLKVTYLPVEADGLLDVDQLRDAITDETFLVSVMAVNNEIGVIQPLQDIGAICRERGVLFHTDAAQALGKIALSVDAMQIDLLSVSGHKIYGPKGVGALYVRRRPRVRLLPLIDGGGQERGLRSGTLATPLVVGLGAAAQLAETLRETEQARIQTLHHQFVSGVEASFPDVVVNGSRTERVAGNVNMSFPGVASDLLITSLKKLAVSSGSACSSASIEASYVLQALGLDTALAKASIRFGIGRFTTQEEIVEAISIVSDTLKALVD